MALPSATTSLVAIILAAILVIWLRGEGLAWYPAALVIVVALLEMAPRSIGYLQVARSFSAHVAFATMIALTVSTSRSWFRGPQYVEDGGFPSLRSLSTFAVIATSLQVALGAAYRNDVVGLVPHVVGAISVTVVLLVVAAFVLTQFPNHVPLKRVAWSVIAIVPVQIALGIIAYIGRLGQPEKAPSTMAASASTVAHVIVGAMTLAASVALARQVFYHVRPPAAYPHAVSAER